VANHGGKNYATLANVGYGVAIAGTAVITGYYVYRIIRWSVNKEAGSPPFRWSRARLCRSAASLSTPTGLVRVRVVVAKPLTLSDCR
jgi:hypothetical protein